jgi:hypothetical protein
LHQFQSGKKFSTKAIAVLKHLPLWEHSESPVSAAQALFVSSRNWIFPDLPVSHAEGLPTLQEFIQYIGGTLLTSFDYVWIHVLPNLPKIVSETQLESIRKLLD